MKDNEKEHHSKNEIKQREEYEIHINYTDHEGGIKNTTNFMGKGIYEK